MKRIHAEVGFTMYDQIQTFKKESSIKKIVGLMMIHYFKWPWYLEDLVH